MAIVASYFDGESYGLLGPQTAATIIEENTPYECIVIGVDRGDDKRLLKQALQDYFGCHEPIIGFSTLSGRQDLFELAGELKKEGAITILAGPQADTDFLGEKERDAYPHRFPGVSECFSFAVHGPAEQILGFLNPETRLPQDEPGFLRRSPSGTFITNPKKPWEEGFLTRVRWGNLFRPDQGTIKPHRITTGQVLQHIGCPHASRPGRVDIPYPSFLQLKNKRQVGVLLRGCSFCDVAVDKGFHGALDHEVVMQQIAGLPENGDGRKIAFELIIENPVPGLPRILRDAGEKGIELSQVNLTLRADWLVRSEGPLREALGMARRMRIRIFLSSVGFESFDDQILQNLHKGLTVETNLRAVRLARQLKVLFPFQWVYSKADGAVHGFIHPTPWDSPETAANIQRAMDRYRLSDDILPGHSVPLIIHHASALADWIREIEVRENLRFERYGSVIGWWEEALLRI
jgi:hypothetical protein